MPRRRRPAKIAIVLVPRECLRELASLRNFYSRGRALWVWETEFIWDHLQLFYQQLDQRIREGTVLEIQAWIDGSTGFGRYAQRPEIASLLAKGLSLHSGISWREDAFIKVDSTTNFQALSQIIREVRAYGPGQLPPPDLSEYCKCEDYAGVRQLAEEFCCSDQKLYNLVKQNGNIRKRDTVQCVEYHMGDTARALLANQRRAGRG